MGGRAVSEYSRLVSSPKGSRRRERELSELKGAWAAACVRELAKVVERALAALLYS